MEVYNTGTHDLRSLGNPDISSYDDDFTAATGKRYNHWVQVVSRITGGMVIMGYLWEDILVIRIPLMDIDITSAGYATDFGDFNIALVVAPASNGSRGLFMGGRSHLWVDTAVDYITIGTHYHNATDFGDTTTNAGQGYLLQGQVR